MFQFRRFPSHTYAFSMGYHDMTHGGLLHSVTPGSLPAYGSPRHFAVCRDLLRLPMPRHSLCALCSLTLHYACFSNFELLEIVVSYPNFFEYLTLISSLLLLFIVQFSRYLLQMLSHLNSKIRCRTAVLPAASRHRSSCFLPSHSAASRACLSTLRFVRRDLTAGSTRWWAQVDSNHRPHAYQACALTT